MASMPGEEVLEFHIRLIPGGRVSTPIADSLKVGDRAQIEGPYCRAHLRPDDDGPLVLIAGSSGPAPANAIARPAPLRPPAPRGPHHFRRRHDGPAYHQSAILVLVPPP